MRSRLATCVLAIVLLMAIGALLIARYPPTAENFISFLGPSSAHWLGTDDLGRDVWSRLVYGARASMEAAGIAVGIALVSGMPIGLLAGFRGGWADAVLMRVADTVLSFPGIILAIAITAMLGPSLVHSMIAVGCWRGYQAAHGGLKAPSWAMMVAMSSAAHSSLILPSVTR
jgi:peptide/nickel transport system permease protein